VAREVVLEQLQYLGMTGYEAKAYTALIAAGGHLTGYEIAKRSGVPRSTVYETLRKLIERGAVFEVTVNGITRYLPLPADAFLTKLRREFDQSTKLLADALPSVVTPSMARIVDHLTGANAVMDRAQELIESAHRDLYLAIWDEEVRKLWPFIEAAEGRGVVTFVLTFGQEDGHLGHYFPHRLNTVPGGVESLASRLLVLASDRSHVLIGSALGHDMQAMFSDDPAVIFVAIEYVRHDIALQELAGRIGLEEVQRIWQQDDALRRVAAQGVPGSGPTWRRSSSATPE
jgi:HTH-type transcriptional regulator, sugar sensing transcriptional regulator